MKPIKSVRKRLIEDAEVLEKKAEDLSEMVERQEENPVLDSCSKNKTTEGLLDESRAFKNELTKSIETRSEEERTPDELLERATQLRIIAASSTTSERREALICEQLEKMIPSECDMFDKTLSEVLEKQDIPLDAQDVVDQVTKKSQERRRNKEDYARSRDPEVLAAIDKMAERMTPDELSAKIKEAFVNKSYIELFMSKERIRDSLDYEEMAIRAIERLKEELETLGCSKEIFDNIFATVNRRKKVRSDDIFDNNDGIEKCLGKALAQAEADMSGIAISFRNLIISKFTDALNNQLGLTHSRTNIVTVDPYDIMEDIEE